MEKQSIDYYRDKDKVFRQETRELKDENKKLKSGLESLTKKINEFIELQTGKKPTGSSKVQNQSNNNQQGVDNQFQGNTPANLPITVNSSLPDRNYPIESPSATRSITVAKAAPKVKRKTKNKYASGPDTISFPVKKGKARETKGPILPPGSFAKGSILTGIDAKSGRTLPSLIALDFAYVAPNNFKVDLSGCFLIMKSTADISSERVEMQPERISCVAKTGGFFERKTNGYVADGFDNRFAMRGELIENFGGKLLKATIASALEGASKAIQMSQTTTTTNPLGGQSNQVSGSAGKYIAAGAASNSASMIAKWYIDQVKKIMPIVRVEAGIPLWVVMTEKIELPQSFFKRVTKEKVDVPVNLTSRSK